MSRRARSRAVPRGSARRLLVAAGGRGDRSDPARRPRGDRGRPDGRARTLGRRVPGLGRARRLSGDRSRRQPGRVLRVPAEVLRDRSNAWFPFGSHLIAGLYHTARSIESTARQRESLVTLGTLAAGLAHEINNPASAATRAVDGLDAACQSLLSALGSARRRTTSRPSSSPRSTRCAARSSRERWTSIRSSAPTESRPSRPGSPATGSSERGPSHPPLAAAGVDLGVVRAGRRRARRIQVSSPAWSGWRTRSRRPRC